MGARGERGGGERKLKGILRFPLCLSLFPCFFFPFSFFFVRPRREFQLSQREPRKKKKIQKIQKKKITSVRAYPKAPERKWAFPSCWQSRHRVSGWERPHDQGHHEAGKEKTRKRAIGSPAPWGQGGGDGMGGVGGYHGLAYPEVNSRRRC